MSRCPITYEEVPEGSRYSLAGLQRLGSRLKDLRDLPYSAEEQRLEAIARASKMSIQGVQPKLSARLNIPNETFEVVDTGGQFILKPQTQYPEVPENEDVTMRLAESVGIEVPFHGLVYSKDGSLTYFVKRFDRGPKKQKFSLEDFAQLLGRSRETKYRSSMEEVASTVEKFCSFPVVENVKLFKRVLLSFLVGNEDMHLKNFSLIRRDEKIELSPAYDLLNTTIVLTNVVEEIALPLSGKKNKLTGTIFFDYYGQERLRLRSEVIDEIIAEFVDAIPSWQEKIQMSFLSQAKKEEYLRVVNDRRRILGI